MKIVYRACRYLAIAILVPGMVLEIIALWDHVPSVLKVVFSFHTRFINPTAGEIIQTSLSAILQPSAFLAASAGIWLLTDIAGALRSRNESVGDKRD